MDEIIVSKKARVEDAEEDEDEEDADESEEEEWQKEAAAQMAAEAEEDARRQEEEAKLAEEEAKKAEKELKKKAAAKGTAGINMPARVDLSIEEAKALFKTLLREKDINPLLPWDTALPQFVSDPRYVLLPSVAARREAFNEYCRDRARELRAAKVASQKAESADPKEEFERLLRDEVKSTRTVWSDWRKTWKKDRRFYGWGRDDREREKRFREWIKELGEQKRAAAQKAEADFIGLLKEKGGIKPDSIWKDVGGRLVRNQIVSNVPAGETQTR
ncbi:hypothetical protein BD410DRAFT_735577 [Rickenella mellea]|uniref:FF domain-containing protein n=1 Tax=Rickenella mellea TaxID=50990 RepID=A0A4Y7PEK1_9AGAM|nr:hypothetical protein BD410DRAFT_735577 [Rickenella mellea]